MKITMRGGRVLGFLAVLVAAAALSPLAAAAQTPAGEEVSNARKLYQRGVEYMNSSRYLDAVEQFQLALDEDPELDDARRLLAFVYTQMGATDPEHYQDALEVYEDLKARLPENDVEVRKNIAYVHSQLGRGEDAIATYEEILKITPQDCTVWAAIGGARQVQADTLRAQKGEAFAQDPEFQAKSDAAVAAFSKVMELCPDSLEVYGLVGKLYWDAGKMDEAAAVYEKLLAKDPNNKDALIKEIYIHRTNQAWGKAIPLYEKLLAIDAGMTDYRVQYADALQKSGKIKEASAQFQKLIDEDPVGNAKLFCNQAILQAFDEGDGEKAIQTAMKGMAANAPAKACLTFAWAKGLELRGTGLIKTGQYDRGITTYREAKLKASSISGDPTFGGPAKQLMDRLDKLIVIGEQTKAKAKQSK